MIMSASKISLGDSKPEIQVSKLPTTHLRIQLSCIFLVHQDPRQKPIRRGLSLLEVVLALAILAVAAAYLAQSMHLAVENATRAQRLSRAETIAESVMNQIVAGYLPVQAVSWTPVQPPNPFGPSGQAADSEQWLYSIQNVQTEVPGMLGVQVGVRQFNPNGPQDIQPDLVINRWITDPQLGLDVPPDTSTTSGGVQ